MARTPLFRALRRHWQAAATPADGITRRHFLAGSARIATAGLVAGPVAACADVVASGKLTGEPVVIVGAGAAGLTAAYALGKAGVPAVVYEAAGRVGGRIWTLNGFNGDGQFIELGAELVDTDHADLRRICAELGVGVQKFSEPPTDLTSEIFHYRGQIYTGRQFEQGLRPFVQAVARARREIGGGASDLSVTYATPMNAAAYDRMTLAEFLDRQTDVEPWVREMVRIAYVGEMGSEADVQSALNLILLMTPTRPGLYGDSDEAWRIAGGSSSMIEALRDAVVRRAGGSADSVLRLRHELTAIRDDGRQLVLSFDHGGQALTVPASRVVLALPFSVLRRVDGIATLGLDPVKKRSIAEYGYGTNTKLMSDFSSRVWRTASNRVPAYDGFLTTDSGHQNFWETSRDQKGSRGVLTNFLGGKAGANFSATAQRAPIRFLATLDPRLGPAFSGVQQFMNWSRYRFALGSYSSPRPGQYTAFFGVEARPELGGRLLFAGEHTSVAYSGFMNGAVESGLRAARQALGRVA
ncbi:NAD(P)/FAD-dependent oxidoreductase [Vineibacter terrae]|uniref:flavin monoamine oxidase family protein n=1 Tax=Vineibacter terrae TaxID=2586908 RepID=UPI002E34E4DB|nr:NAD(P)/FAD-dependent oxidoreductase [Vineibacter terrae]HEX2886113.1 NAD(P)/FAD-dependent oxidoreductase [Vineibacter terrae]